MTSLVVATAFAVMATAQTSTSTQTAGSTTQRASATAGKAGASTASSTGATATQATQTTAKGAAANASASAANQTSGTLNLPPGTKISAMLSKSIDSKKAKAGDKVEAKTVVDVVSQGKVVIPRNSKLLGHITESHAKARGEAESRLGIVFDSIMMTKKGQTAPLHANIQAIGAAVVSQSASAGPVGTEDAGAAGGGAMGSTGSGGSSLGGATGAVGSAVGGAAGSAGGLAGGVDTAGNAAGGVGSTLGTATQGSLSAAGNSVALHGVLNSSSSGVVGLKGLQLSSATGSSASGSVVTSTGKSVKLDSGSQLMLNVAGGTSPAVQ